METEVKVINFGKRGGKVVRRFPMETYPVFAKHFISLCYACRARSVALEDALKMFTSLGYSPAQCHALAVYNVIVSPSRRKEVTYGTFYHHQDKATHFRSPQG